MTESTYAIITVIAILLSPIVPVLITLGMARRKEKRDAKLFIFAQMFGTRYDRTSREYVRALNTIDLVFYKNKEVRKLWNEYHALLNTPGQLSNENGFRMVESKNIELLRAMAHDLNYRSELTDLDLLRTYEPMGWSKPSKQEQVWEELLTFLKESNQRTKDLED